MSIQQETDFATGRFRIPLDPQQEADLQSYIDDVEAEYLPKMFGVELYDLFIADLALPVAGEPTAPRFIKVFEPFIDQTEEILTQSEGIVKMLNGITYYLYVRDLIGKVTTNGTKVTISENSVNISGVQYDISSRYNDGIANYKTIQNFMLNVDPTTYPEFKGVNERFTSIF